MLPKIPKISQITPGIIRILGMNPSPMTLQGTNSYILGNPSSNKRLMIDTSSPNMSDYIDNLRQYFTYTENKPAYISDVLLTHWHSDHIGSLPAVMEFARSQNWPLPTIHKFQSSSHPDCVDCKVDEVHDGQIFDLKSFGMDSLKVLYTPGHTDDHICLLLIPDQILFCGDIILGHGSTVFENLSQYMDSLAIIKSMENRLSLLLPGHGLEVSSPKEKIDEYMKHRTSRIEEVSKALSGDKWQFEEEILKKVYAPEILMNEKLFLGALSNQFQALEYLSRQHKAESRDPTDKEKISSTSQFSISGKLWKSKVANAAKL